MSSFKKNVKIMLLITLSIKILGFIYKILLARYLNLEVLNTIALLNPIINLSLVLSSMSIPIVVNRNVSKNLTSEHYYNRGFISSAIKITFISTSLIILIVLLFTNFIANTLYHNENLILPIIIMLPLLYFSNFSGIIKSYLEAHNDFKNPVISNLLEQILKFIFAIFVIFILKERPTIVIVCYLSLTLTLCEITSFSYLILKTKKVTKLKLVKTKLKDDTKIIRPSLYLTLFSLILTLDAFIEPIIYYSFTRHVLVSLEDSNYFYTIIHSFALPFLQIGSFLTYVSVKLLFPKLARNTFDNAKTIYYIKYSFYVLLFMELIMLNLSIFHSSSMLTLLYHTDCASSIVKILSPFSFLVFLSPILTTVLEAQKCEKKLLLHGFLACILSLFILAITALIQKISLYSLLIAYISKELIYYSLNFIYLKKKIKLKISFKYAFILLLSISIPFLFHFTINIPNEWIQIVVETFIIIVIHSFVFRSFRTQYKVR